MRVKLPHDLELCVVSWLCDTMKYYCDQGGVRANNGGCCDDNPQTQAIVDRLPSNNSAAPNGFPAER